MMRTMLLLPQRQRGLFAQFATRKWSDQVSIESFFGLTCMIGDIATTQQVNTPKIALFYLFTNHLDILTITTKIWKW